MTNQTDQKAGLKIVRDFKAPKSLVFQAFSTAEAFANWWGPAGTGTFNQLEVYLAKKQNTN